MTSSIEEGKIEYFVEDLGGRHAYNCSCHADLSPPGYSSVLCLLYFLTIVCVELCDPLFGLLFHYLFLKVFAALVSQAKKSKVRTQRQVLQAAS